MHEDIRLINDASVERDEVLCVCVCVLLDGWVDVGVCVCCWMGGWVDVCVLELPLKGEMFRMQSKSTK